MTEQQRAVGIFNNATEAEAALRKLDESHFSLDKVYVIARNTEREGKIEWTIDNGQLTMNNGQLTVEYILFNTYTKNLTFSH